MHRHAFQHGENNLTTMILFPELPLDAGRPPEAGNTSPFSAKSLWRKPLPAMGNRDEKPDTECCIVIQSNPKSCDADAEPRQSLLLITLQTA
jgi:hypothetical protein